RPRFSKCPPSERLTYWYRSVVLPAASEKSGPTEYRGPARFHVLLPAGPGFPSHHPRRTLNSVIKRLSTGEEWYPMLGLAAAPEMASAVPRVMPSPYSRDGR